MILNEAPSAKQQRATLARRGFDLGSVELSEPIKDQPHWADGQALILRGIASSELASHTEDLAAAQRLHQHVLSGQSAELLLDTPAYASRWEKTFEALGSSINPGAQQEIECLFFDAVTNDEIIAEDLWMKISWLSFYENDDSLRFRFSFGIDHEEDVAADPLRQLHSAHLCDAVFPESRLIIDNVPLRKAISQYSGIDDLEFVERIIYFNAVNGGAYLHHDLERGHAGVVYLQATGTTVWIALAKSELLSQIRQHLKDRSPHSQLSITEQAQIADWLEHPNLLETALDSFSNDLLIHIINETPEFIARLANSGFMHQLNPGDAIILPQSINTSSEHQNCCWHSVFTVGSFSGEGLSFAFKPMPSHT